MSSYYFLLTITLVSAMLPCAMGALRFKALDIPSRIFCAMLVIGFASEIAGFIMARLNGNNMAVYNISNLLQMFTMCLYFNYTINKFKRHHAGWYLGFFSILLGILNMVYLQPVDQPNTYFSNYRMVMVVLLTMVLLQNDLQPALFDYRIQRSVHFWLTFLLANLVILKFIAVNMYDVFLENLGRDMYVVDLFIVLITVLFNLGFALVLFLYPKINVKYGTR